MDERRPASVMLKTEDMAATLAWYERVGFDVRGRSPDEGVPAWLEVERDGVVLQFLAGDTPWPESPRLTGTLYFHPQSVDDLHERIRDDVEIAWGPEDRAWGMREMGLRDPNGYFLTFTQPAAG
jgi:catechol 2,3-dioxygenase-like lactoylglutathione lyase family enzyme